MKNHLSRFVFLLGMIVVPFFVFFQEYGNVLSESFETGIPTEWIQDVEDI